MKMPNGGFAPGYNVQFASTTKGKAIVGFSVTQAGHDYGQISGMLEQIKKRYEKYPTNYLVDEGFLQHGDVKKASKHTNIYVPADTIKETARQSSILLEIKKRMNSPEAKEIYKQRSATAEFVNARTRNRGLTQVLVSGLKKVTTMVCLFAIGNNMLLWLSANKVN